ncbi:MAG: AAA family ATPase [Micavibrio sp.]|nr:AAA family ATPase [Micavibrio sp.]
MADNNKAAALGPNSDFLIRGSDYLAQQPDFKLVGRDKELKEVSNVLMRKDANNLLLTGQAGVGISALVQGLQASKDDTATPFDIISKRFYWLDTDALFSSGDSAKINEGFQKTLETLKRAPDTVLVIEDSRGFFDGCRNNGATNLINALMREIRSPDLQAIFQTRDNDLAEVLRSHADLRDDFTLMEVKEPAKDALELIVKQGAQSLEKYHGIKISDEALGSAADLTRKYLIKQLESGQPNRTFMLLEGALTALRAEAHTTPMAMKGLNARMNAVDAAISGKGVTPDTAGKSPSELQAMKLDTQTEINDVMAVWDERQKKLRALYIDQRKGEEAIRDLDAALEKERQAQADAAKKYEAEQASGTAAPAAAETSTKALQFKLGKSGFDTGAERELRSQRAQWQKLVEDNKAKFSALTAEIDNGLELKGEHVLGEFSRLSGVPVSRLGQDETTKLLKLEDTLKKRVFGQDDPVSAVAKSVRRGRTGMKKANKPIGSFLFLGPSGVGKTELAKALAETLFGDESSLNIYNMSEYQEKHAVSTLIGAPPGYEGYADGGLLTNNMRRRPYVVNVFDEIEKGHKDIYDLFLQILDEGKLNDRRGLTASFADSINIMTSNIGAEFFLREDLTFDQAKEEAMKVLWNPDKENGGSGYRPEFLNRFTGIFCFNRLGQPEIMMIADKTFKEINSWIVEKGLNVAMDPEQKKDMCQLEYVPRGGARSIMKFIENNITSDVSDEILRNPDDQGTLQVSYDKGSRTTKIDFVRKGEAAPAEKPANENGQRATAAFKATQ